MKVEHNVEREDDVDYAVGDEYGHVVHRLRLEGHIVWHEESGVDGEQQYEPVPDVLERAVVKNDVRRRFGRLLAILRQELAIEVERLV